MIVTDETGSFDTVSINTARNSCVRVSAALALGHIDARIARAENHRYRNHPDLRWDMHFIVLLRVRASLPFVLAGTIRDRPL
jgi:hypothetical protein